MQPLNINSTITMPTIQGEPMGRCSTRTDSFSINAPSETVYNGMSVNISNTPTPLFMGGRPTDIGGILSTKAWTVEAHINLGKLAMHLGKKLTERAFDTMDYALSRYMDYQLGDDVALSPKCTFNRCANELEQSSKVLEFLELLTIGCKIEATEKQWQSHFEYIRKGKSNPGMPVNKEFSALTERLIDYREALIQHQQELASYQKNPNNTRAARLIDACRKLDSDLEQNFRQLTGNFESLTGYTQKEFIDQMWSLKDRFVTDETLDLPEDQQELRRMSIAEAYGMVSPEQMKKAMQGDMRSVKFCTETPQPAVPVLSLNEEIIGPFLEMSELAATSLITINETRVNKQNIGYESDSTVSDDNGYGSGSDDSVYSDSDTEEFIAPRQKHGKIYTQQSYNSDYGSDEET